MVPAVTAVNSFPAQKVTQALTKAREAFIAAFLDRRVIQDGNVEVLAAGFAPDTRKHQREDTANRIRIAPGFRLLPVSPKVTGSMSVEPGDRGELKIRANYAVAYAFDIDDPKRIEDVMDIVAVVRLDWRYVYRDGGTFEAGSRGAVAGRRHHQPLLLHGVQTPRTAPAGARLQREGHLRAGNERRGPRQDVRSVQADAHRRHVLKSRTNPHRELLRNGLNRR